MKKALSVIIVFMLLCCSLTAGAITLYTEGAYTFADVNNDYVSLYGFDNSSDTLVVPESFKSKYVSSVYEYAFENNTEIKKIDFSNCSGHFSDIATRAFSGCSSLSGNLIIPSSVKTLGFACFEGTGLSSVNMNCKVKDIPVQCFYGNAELETVYLPVNAESVGNLAFANCPKLKDVYFPSSVTSISEAAFKDSGDVVFHCFRKSYALRFAKENGFDYVIVNPLMGDANDDDTVDISDVTYIQKYLVGAEGFDLDDYQYQCADVNADGEVTLRDATQIQKYLVGIIPAL